MKFQQIAADLAALLEIDDLCLDEKASLTFTFDETVILMEEINNGLLLTGFVDVLPTNGPLEALLKTCLLANFNAIKSELPIIAIEETTQSVILQQRLAYQPAQALVIAMEQFAKQIESICDSLRKTLSTPINPYTKNLA